MKRHPEAIAWSRWILSAEGKGCMKGMAEGRYLENRLACAFSAGYQTCVKLLTQPVEERTPGERKEG